MIDPTTEPDPSAFTQEDVLTWLDKQDVPRWISVLSRTMITLFILTAGAFCLGIVWAVIYLIFKSVL